MNIFNLFKKGKEPATQVAPIPVQCADSCAEDSKQAVEGSIKPTSFKLCKFHQEAGSR